MPYYHKEIIVDSNGTQIAESELNELTFEEARDLVFPKVVEALTDGRKIYAIKMYRELMHCSLKDAKAAIDLLQFVLHPYYELRQKLEQLAIA